MANDSSSLLSISEAAEILNLHTDTLRDWDQAGIFKPLRVGRRGDRRYRLEDIQLVLREGVKAVQAGNYNNSSLDALESKYHVNYPETNAATYTSLVNYRKDLSTPFQRWYNYKEGYSLELNELIFTYFGVEGGDVILDPFSGSGSTLLAAKNHNLQSIGYEVNPFSHFLSVVKTRNYSKKNRQELEKIHSFIKAGALPKKTNFSKPKLSTIDKVFNKEIYEELVGVWQLIKDTPLDDKSRDAAFMAWLATLEEVSNYRKAGNGLKIRKAKNWHPPKPCDRIAQRLQDMIDDIELISSHNPEPQIKRGSSLDLAEDLPPGSVKGVVFSPPYANCFDYTEIYKVELWMGGYVKEYADLKKLRNETVKSHLNRNLESQQQIKDPLLAGLLERISQTKLWDKRIPSMVEGYFEDMNQSLQNIYKALKPGGFCCVIVSNSAYSGIVVPTDLLIARLGEAQGFKIRKIDVARFIITSSQQYEKTAKWRKYLRESIIYMEKV